MPLSGLFPFILSVLCCFLFLFFVRCECLSSSHNSTKLWHSIRRKKTVKNKRKFSGWKKTTTQIIYDHRRTIRATRPQLCMCCTWLVFDDPKTDFSLLFALCLCRWVRQSWKTESEREKTKREKAEKKSRTYAKHINALQLQQQREKTVEDLRNNEKDEKIATKAKVIYSQKEFSSASTRVITFCGYARVCVCLHVQPAKVTPRKQTQRARTAFNGFISFFGGRSLKFMN